MITTHPKYVPLNRADMSSKQVITEMAKQGAVTEADETIAGLDLCGASHKWDLTAQEVHQLL